MSEAISEIRENSTIIKATGKVFYNPVQEFNRDLSISVLRLFLDKYNGTNNSSEFKILEALSATGLRSIRYAKEVPGVSQIIANDISRFAVQTIQTNIIENNVEKIVIPTNSDATILMYENRMRDKRFDAIDLDPYGCPAQFLDGAVQALKDGGLLLVTATDMAVLAGNCPETCYSKYGSISLRTKSCHEMAVRILLQCIEAHANRYGRYIVPLLSISADFYIRVFVQIYTSPQKCKGTLSKLSMVYHCSGCGSVELQPLGLKKFDEKRNSLKYTLPTNKIGSVCPHCQFTYQMGGPIWAGPIHDREFVTTLLENIQSDQSLGTLSRLLGVLTVIEEELNDTPLYVTLAQLSGTLHAQMPKMVQLKSALLNANYKVSGTHMNPNGIKTTAPMAFVWSIMRSWCHLNPISRKRLEVENSVAMRILSNSNVEDVLIDFKTHPGACAESQRLGLVRYQQNPKAFWGPGTRANFLPSSGDKKQRNQGKKRKKTLSETDSTN